MNTDSKKHDTTTTTNTNNVLSVRSCALSKDDMGDSLCKYCPLKKKGVYGVDGGYMAGCEGSRCDEAYENYLLSAVRVQWRVSANIECPHCEHVNDFMTVDEWWVFTQIAENNEEFYCPVEFTCEQCKQDFTVNGSDY